MWRSSAALLLLGSLFATTTARAEICLPPVFEGGRQLVYDGIEVGGLDLLLRQHEACWRSPKTADERRVFVFGNSAIFGFPNTADDSAIEVLNRRFEADGVPAHLFNLGFVLSYNLKDSLIVHESLRYQPDAIVFSVMLDDFVHVAPLRYAPLKKFFNENSRAVERFADEAPASIGEGFASWRDFQADDVRRLAAWRSLRDAGSLLRVAAGAWTRRLLERWFPDLPPRRPVVEGKKKYRCEEVTGRFAKLHTGWTDWNPLAYLEQVQRETGAEILIVNWPAAEDPRGACFNRRYLRSDLAVYRTWIEADARARGFQFVDLQPDFPQDEFIDSVHPTVAGQAEVARLLEPHIRKLVRSAP